MIDKSVSDAVLGLIFFMLAPLYYNLFNPKLQALQLDRDGFTYRKITKVRVAWQDVTDVRPGAVVGDWLGLVLVSRKNKNRPLSISGYYDVSADDLAHAMMALAGSSRLPRAA